MQITKAYIIRIDDPLSRNYSHECAESCVKYGVKYEFYEGVDVKTSPADFPKATGYRVTPDGFATYGELLATASHARLWEKIARNAGRSLRSSHEAVAILEHDCIVKNDFQHYPVMDGEIINLGYRVESRVDFTFPTTKPRLYPTARFDGAHAYALTPNTAAALVKKLNKRLREPVESWLGIENRAELELMCADPPPVVCETGSGRRSLVTVSHRSSPVSYLPFSGFFDGLETKKYWIQGGMGWLRY